MNPLEKLQQKLIDFRNERDWKQFHNGKDLALALSIEAAELNELFLWKDPSEVDLPKLKEELADVFAYAFLMADCYGLDVEKIVEEKIVKNGIKYPVDKSKGSNTKYSEL
ncbi:MAG: nucleotide pyrophosphohydrolase [Bacteroidia bacterium]|nr:nucleotide pyrophosphohydrolase [Bacteroidia bacterium]